jgi:hypothetical protein
MTQKTTSIHAEASLHRKLVLFAVQLEGYLAHFPNCHKYTLTQGIRQAYLDVYNLVTEAQKRYHKKTALTQLDVRHEQLRMMLQLAHEMGLFGFNAGRRDLQAPGGHRFLVISRSVDELGRMIGGWLQKQALGHAASGDDIHSPRAADAVGV